MELVAGCQRALYCQALHYPFPFHCLAGERERGIPLGLLRSSRTSPFPRESRRKVGRGALGERAAVCGQELVTAFYFSCVSTSL